jgi:hypothetical protein
MVATTVNDENVDTVENVKMLQNDECTYFTTSGTESDDLDFVRIDLRRHLKSDTV